MFRRCLLSCLLLGLAASALWAADVWVAKPYTEWSEKDIRKIMTDSPWARSVSVELEMRGPIRRPVSLRGPAPIVPSADSPGIAETAAANGPANPMSAPPPPPGFRPACPNLIVRWQTSRAVQQALVKAEYREKAGSSAEAKKRLEASSAYYIIAVACLPDPQKPRDDDERQTQLRRTTLTIPGKDHPIVARDMVWVEGTGDDAGIGEARFLFPRDFAVTVDDKEAEFATKFGKAAVKARFKLKSMVLNGALGL